MCNPISGNLDGQAMEVAFFKKPAQRDEHLRKHVLVASSPTVLPEDLNEVLMLNQEIKGEIGAYLRSIGNDPEQARCLGDAKDARTLPPLGCWDESRVECPHRVTFCHARLSRLAPYYQRCVDSLIKNQDGREFLCHVHANIKGGDNITVAGLRGLRVGIFLDKGKVSNLKTAFFHGPPVAIENPAWLRDNWRRLAEWQLHDLLKEKAEASKLTFCCTRPIGAPR
jgi:hypothetical protein